MGAERVHGLFQPIEGHIEDEDQTKQTVISEEGVEWGIEADSSSKAEEIAPMEDAMNAMSPLDRSLEGDEQGGKVSKNSIERATRGAEVDKELSDLHAAEDYSERLDDQNPGPNPGEHDPHALETEAETAKPKIVSDKSNASNQIEGTFDLEDEKHDLGSESRKTQAQKSEGLLTDHAVPGETESSGIEPQHISDETCRLDRAPSHSSSKDHSKQQKSEKNAPSAEKEVPVASGESKHHRSPKPKNARLSTRPEGGQNDYRLRHRHRRHRSAEDHHESERRKPSHVRVNPRKHHSSHHDKRPDNELKSHSNTSSQRNSQESSSPGPSKHGQHEIKGAKDLPLAMRVALAVRSSVQGHSIHESRPLSMPPLDRRPHPPHDSHHGFNEHTLSAFVHSASHSDHHQGHQHRYRSGSKTE